jgi:hypothetical protein
MTPEKIKKIAAAVPEGCEVVSSEIQAIYEAAEKDPFLLIGYAYAYGFHRGSQQEHQAHE